jgi:hypothetical protein
MPIGILGLITCTKKVISLMGMGEVRSLRFLSRMMNDQSIIQGRGNNDRYS